MNESSEIPLSSKEKQVNVAEIDGEIPHTGRGKANRGEYTKLPELLRKP